MGHRTGRETDKYACIDVALQSACALPILSRGAPAYSLAPSLHCIEISQPVELGTVEKRYGVTDFCNSRRTERDY